MNQRLWIEAVVLTLAATLGGTSPAADDGPPPKVDFVCRVYENAFVIDFD